MVTNKSWFTYFMYRLQILTFTNNSRLLADLKKIQSIYIGIFTYIAFSRSFKKEGASSSSSSESSKSKSMSRSLCLSPAAIKLSLAKDKKKIHNYT